VVFERVQDIALFAVEAGSTNNQLLGLFEIINSATENIVVTKQKEAVNRRKRNRKLTNEDINQSLTSLTEMVDSLKTVTGIVTGNLAPGKLFGAIDIYIRLI